MIINKFIYKTKRLKKFKGFKDRKVINYILNVNIIAKLKKKTLLL